MAGDDVVGHLWCSIVWDPRQNNAGAQQGGQGYDKDGKETFVPNPDYACWISLDQCVLGYLVRNMSREIITQMVG
jgi:hypothetical protein